MLVIRKAKLLEHVVRLCAQPTKRIQPFKYQRKIYWLKQQERPRPTLINWWGTVLTKLTKNPLYIPATSTGPEALRAEARRLRKLSTKGVPVAKVVAEGDGWLVLPHLGTAIRDLVKNPDLTPDNRKQILIAAADSLGKLHKQGIWHGKPTLRDMIWDGQQIWYVDFEEDPRAFMSPDLCMVRDLMFFIYSLFRYLQPADQLLNDVVQTYQNLAPEKIWQDAKAQARRMSLVYWVCALFYPLRIRDMRQTYHMLHYLRHSNC